jgi:hypothetical protein
MENMENFLENLDNIIIEDILTKEDVDGIYNVIDNAPEEKTEILKSLGHKAYLVKLDESLRQKFERIVQDKYGDTWKLEDLQFARYSLDYGYTPKLYPHFDNIFTKHRLTLDVQVFGSRPWPLVVEGVKKVLNDGDGLIFSGTSQIHWRDNLEFTKDDRFDMIFCHFHNSDDTQAFVTEKWYDYMKTKESEWYEKINISKAPIELTKG